MAGLPALSGADQETVSAMVLRGTGTTATSLTAAGRSVTSVTVMVTVASSVAEPSEAVTVTV